MTEAILFLALAWAIFLSVRLRKNNLLLKSENQRLEGDLVKARQVELKFRQLSLAAENIQAGVIISDLAGAIQYVNPAFCRSTGYTPEEVIGIAPHTLNSDYQSPEFYQQYWSDLHSGATRRGELRNRCKDGSLITVEEIISSIRDESGVISHFVAVLLAAS